MNMSGTKVLRSLLVPRPSLRPSHKTCQIAHSLSSRRTFLSNPLASLSSKPQTLTASRTVPYPAAPIYTVISDVASYSKFLPLLQSSTVTKLSNPDTNGKRWPEEATLTIGYSGSSSPIPISESFTSRLYCSPTEYTVEALSGPEPETSLKPDSIAHHNARPRDPSQDSSRGESALAFLRTRWMLRPFPFRPGPQEAGQSPLEHDGGERAPAREQTEVVLSIEYRFANPIYAALGQAVAPKVAEWMVKAFEERLGEVLQKGAGQGPTYRG